MVKVVIDNNTGKELQDFVIRDLAGSIFRDLSEMKCLRCTKDTKIHIRLNKNKLNGMQIRINACCNTFRKEINKALLLNQEN